MKTPGAPPSSRRLRIVQVATVVIIVAASATAIYFREELQAWQHYGYAAVFVVGLVSNATLILPLPGLAVSSMVGGVFNPWWVGIVGGSGQALGELSGYMAGYSGHRLVDRTPVYDRVRWWMERYGVWTVFVLALVPNPLFDIGGIIAGASRMPVWKFLLSCMAGKVLKNILFALLGSYGIGATLELWPFGQ